MEVREKRYEKIKSFRSVLVANSCRQQIPISPLDSALNVIVFLNLVLTKTFQFAWESITGICNSLIFRHLRLGFLNPQKS